MARTKDEIEREIKASFMGNKTLLDLYKIDTTETTDYDEFFSSVAFESILISLIAYVLYIHESIYDAFRSEIEERIENEYVMSIPWYYKKALEFQLGYGLTYNPKNYSFGYSQLDENKRIIKYAAVKLVKNTITELNILVAGEGKHAITADQLAQFTAYMNEIGAAGAHYRISSGEPEALTLELSVIYNALLLDASGTLVSDGSTKPVEKAISKFLEGIEYGGSFYLSDLLVAIKGVQGVIDAEIQGVTVGGAESTFRKVESQTGSFLFDTENSTINYSL